MLMRFGLAALLIGVVEIWVMVQVAEATSVTTTVLLLILFSAGGAWIVKREGLAAMRRLQGNLRASTFPASDVVDGFLILAAGALLLPPGFITGIVGLLLIVPPVRRLAGRLLSESFRVRIATRMGADQAAAASAAGGGAWRAYRRPGEPGAQRPGGPSGRPPSGDVLDVEGEEVDLFGSGAELGPTRGD
jgi:UPF0716 protein FxsA